MKLTCNQADLRDAAKSAAAVIDKKSAMPIMASIALRAERDRVVLTGSDTTTRTDVVVEADVDGGHIGESVCLDAAAFVDAVDGLPKGSVTIETNPSFITTIRGGRRTMELVGRPGDDYPVPPQRPTKWQKVPGAVLCELLADVAHAMSNDPTRPHLHCLRIEGDGLLLRAMASDGHRLAKGERQVRDVSIAVSIPGRIVREVQRIVAAQSGNDAPIEIAFNENTIAVRDVRTTVTGALTDQTFPAWQQVVPQTHTRRVRASRLALIDSIRACAKVSKLETASITLALKAGEIEVATSNPHRASGRDVVNADLEGEPLRFGINSTYLVEALSAIRGDDAVIEMCGELDPVVCRPVKGDEQLSVTMPMRID